MVAQSPVMSEPPAKSACSAGDARDVCLIPGSGRSPGGGHGNPLQYSCLGNPMDREVWQAPVHEVAKSQNDRSDWAHTHSQRTQLRKPSLQSLTPTYTFKTILFSPFKKLHSHDLFILEVCTFPLFHPFCPLPASGNYQSVLCIYELSKNIILVCTW